jgi:hypothetical protein
VHPSHPPYEVFEHLHNPPYEIFEHLHNPAWASVLQPPPRALPKASDLSTFKGYGDDGSAAESYLELLEDSLVLYQVSDEDRVKLAGLSFPHSTPAAVHSRTLQEELNSVDTSWWGKKCVRTQALGGRH